MSYRLGLLTSAVGRKPTGISERMYVHYTRYTLYNFNRVIPVMFPLGSGANS